MRISANYKSGITRIRALIDHPMETGLRRDRRGTVIPRNTIESLSILKGSEVVLEAELGHSVSRNPYFSFEIEGGAPGEEFTISWTDSEGKVVTRTVLVE